MMASPQSLDLTRVRSQFPALATNYIYADNAGGSQIVQGCIEQITDYLTNTNVQLGADYEVSVKSTERVKEGKRAVAELFGVEGNETEKEECVVVGSSSTLLVENLARAVEANVKPGDEFIVTGEHEANAGPWKRLAARAGASVRYWNATPTSPNNPNPYSVSHQLSALLPLITPNTRLIAFPACSNILGTAIDVKKVVEAVREKAKEVGCRKMEISVDCVAYAPHRQMNVTDWGVDYCVFSLYKVYGPHVAALYTHPTALETSVSSLAHHFLSAYIPVSPTTKLQPGGPGYELVYSATAIPAYLRSLSSTSRLEDSFNSIKDHEQQLVKRLLGWLSDKKRWERGVRIVGESLEDLGNEVTRRVPTISFVVVGERALNSKDVVKVFDQKGGIGIRYGHFYAYTLIDNFEPKVDPADGVVRISLVHYNSMEEVERIIENLEEVLGN